MEFFKIVALFLLLRLCSAQNYRVCTDVRTEYCPGVQLGDSRVSCVTAQTRIDCALKLASGDADFTVLNEEEVLLVSQQQPEYHAVLASLRHQEKLNDSWAFESVAVVRANYTGGLEGLRGAGFCHPGYDIFDQRWSPRVLRYFEDTVAQTTRNCDERARTPAGSQASALEQFFGKACRPGVWAEDPTEDALLKSKHTSLCELCQDQNCNVGYGNTGTSVSSHLRALSCLTDGGATAVGGGDVAYIAWQQVRTYFQSRADASSYALLCADGSTRQLTAALISNSTAACSWVRQPWPAIVSSRSVSSGLLANLKSWLPSGRANTTSASWIRSLDGILFSDAATYAVYNDSTPTTTDYVTPGRGAQMETSGCQRAQRWCTISAAETLKCNWIRRAAISLGIEPAVECVQLENEIGCLNNIQMERADFISLDSNYGYLARKHYKTATVLYHQTQKANSSRVVALLKESSTTGQANDTITRFENLRGKTACFPEYGGIAWVAFVRAAHERQVISEKTCAYGSAVAEFFGSACAPGADLTSHTMTSIPTTLCSACRSNPALPSTTTVSSVVSTASDPTSPLIPTAYAELQCSANYSNLYFSTNGTLACIAAEHTDVAFIETQYLSQYFTSLNLNASNYRVLCRNNTLASRPGVDVDDACLLAHVVDGEILARGDWEQTIALRSLFYTLDNLFGYSSGVNQLIGLQIFASFNGVSDLLFKNSVIGLADSDSTSELARNYEDLFKHLDACSSAPASTTALPPTSAGRIILPLLGVVLAPLLARLVN